MTFPKMIAKTNPMPYGFTVIKAKGSRIKTEEHGWMIDLTSGIAVNNLGHGNRQVQKAVNKQMKKHAHVMVYGELVQETQTQYAEKLINSIGQNVFLTESCESKIWFASCGASANETALKLAYLNGLESKRKGFIAVEGGFHGRTIGSLGVTYRPKYRKPFEKLYPRGYCEWIAPDEQIPEKLENSSAMILEIIRGEDGVRSADYDWLCYVRNWCTTHGVLLIVDEVQTGFARTSSLFATDDDYIQPDIITMGKAMGGGLPLGGVVASEKLFEQFETKHPFSHLSTFGGNPVSCAAGMASFDQLSKPKFLHDVYFKGLLVRDIFLDVDLVTEVRGRGLMLGVEFETPEIAISFVEKSWKHGLWVGFVLHDARSVRIYPPLTITLDEIEQIKQKVKAVVKEIKSETI